MQPFSHGHFRLDKGRFFSVRAETEVGGLQDFLIYSCRLEKGRFHGHHRMLTACRQAFSRPGKAFF
jgi:hypothetical protein